MSRRIKIYFSLFFSISCLHLSGQNLVINNSFENGNPGSAFEDGFDYCFDWNPFLSVDYHQEGNSNSATFPGSVWGYQEPYTGQRMAGIRAFDFRSTNWHEYIYTELMEELEADELYYVSFQLSPSEGVAYVTDDIGLYLSKDPPPIYDDPLGGASIFYQFTPQVKNKEGNFYEDLTRWYQLEGYYKAEGGEQYITIGNFETDEASSFKEVGGIGVESAYFFIDEVIVEKCPSPISLDLEGDGDITICKNEYTIDVFNEGATYLWSNGSTQSNITITKSGIYSVKVEKDGCYLMDSVQVNMVTMNALGADTTICKNDVITLDASTPYGSYLWQDGSKEITYEVSTSGLYWVDVSSDICNFRDSINVYFAQQDLSIFPNPSSGKFTLRNNSQPIQSLDIYDTSGKLLYENHSILELEMDFDFKGIASGLYFLKTDTDACRATKKLIIIDK